MYVGKSEESERASIGGHSIDGVIKSAKRVLELFEFFAECRRPLAVGDVVNGLGYPQSSASALLQSLARLGYLTYDRHKRLYTPTLRVALFGGWVTDELYSHANLSRLIDNLQRETDGLSVLLGMQNSIYVQYIHLVQPARSEIPWYTKPGSLRPLCRSAAGKLLLSLKTDVEVQQLAWRANAEETEPGLRVEIHCLLKEIDLARSQGYASSFGAVNPRIGAVAIEMPVSANKPPMAIGIGGPVERVRQESPRLVDLLRQATAPYRGPVPAVRSRVHRLL